tara:strand:- start:132 stop:1052 length:921 start_codon:yes stop_codon:yes gene_type:complete
MFARLLPALLLAGCAATPTPDAVSMPSLAAANLSGASFSESCEDWDEWDKAAPPVRILGNSWYVGTCGIAAILVASPQGHVLIDSGTEAGGELILANLRRIGVDPEDVRYILASHEHFDHVGGHAILAKATGAQIIASPLAAPVLESGMVSDEDPQADAGRPAMAPVKVARIIQDGETLTLGDIAITAHATPGHTPGAMSYTWTACASDDEPPACRRIAYVDSLSPVSADNYRFSDHPQTIAAFRTSISKVSQLPCDELLTPHPSASSLIEKLRDGTLGSPGQCQRYAAALTSALDKRLSKERAGG